MIRANDLSGMGRHDLETEVLRLRAQTVQQRELLERQGTEVHAIRQELIGLGRDADRITRELDGLRERIEGIGAAGARRDGG